MYFSIYTESPGDGGGGGDDAELAGLLDMLGLDAYTHDQLVAKDEGEEARRRPCIFSSLLLVIDFVPFLLSLATQVELVTAVIESFRARPAAIEGRSQGKVIQYRPSAKKSFTKNLSLNFLVLSEISPNKICSTAATSEAMGR